MRTALLLIAASTVAAQPDRAGLPACRASGQELAVRSAFVLCHSADRKTALWTAYELRPENLDGDAARPKRFRRDTALTQPGASDSGYRNSGYARGHLVPARDMAFSEEAIQDSFLLSNAVPQNPQLNSGKWRMLENAIRRLASSADFVIVFTGPVFCEDPVFSEDMERIGVSGVAVPCQLYKVVLASRASKLEAFAAVLPNSGNPDQPLREFATSVEEVERRTGLDFFQALPAELQRALESSSEPLP